MDYHGRIMNIPVAPPPDYPVWSSAYKQGHRDARHAAAEIALEAQREISALTDCNQHQDEMIRDQAAEIARLREALSNLLAVAEGKGGTKYDAHEIARAALARVQEVGNG